MPGHGELAREAGLLSTARSLEVDRITGEVVGALAASDVEVLLLKGPALTSWLYDDGTPRPYLDCDLLVPPPEHRRAEEVLASLGFVRDRSADHLVARYGPLHADAWTRASDGAQVDLHRSLPGTRMGAADVWAAMARDSCEIKVGAARVPVPRLAARALVVALHAAHHGPDAAQPLEDLARAIERATAETWSDAAELAEWLHVTPQFAGGLRLVPGGAALAGRLGLPSAALIEEAAAGRRASAVLGVERLAKQATLRGKAVVLLRELFPTPRFMRWWTPLARRGPLGLAAAYVWRLVWLAWVAIPSIRAWRRRGARS